MKNILKNNYNHTSNQTGTEARRRPNLSSFKTIFLCNRALTLPVIIIIIFLIFCTKNKKL
jgi:hypothetical protein